MRFDPAEWPHQDGPPPAWWPASSARWHWGRSRLVWNRACRQWAREEGTLDALNALFVNLDDSAYRYEPDPRTLDGAMVEVEDEIARRTMAFDRFLTGRLTGLELP